MRKKIFGLGLLAAGLILALSLTGCPNGDNGETQPPPLSGITLDRSGTLENPIVLVLETDNSAVTITATRDPAAATDNITWVNADGNYLTMNQTGLSATFTANAATVAPVAVHARSNAGIESASVYIEVREPLVLTGLSFADATRTVEQGGTITLTPIRDPLDATDMLVWDISTPGGSTYINLTPSADTWSAVVAGVQETATDVTVRVRRAGHLEDAATTATIDIEVTAPLEIITAPRTWNFGGPVRPQGWVERNPIGTPNDNDRNNNVDILWDGLWLLPSRVTNEVGTGGGMAWGPANMQVSTLQQDNRWFLEIPNVQGPFTVVVEYSSTGSNTDRNLVFIIDDQEVGRGPITATTGNVTGFHNYTGTGTVNVRLALTNAIRISTIELRSTPLQYPPVNNISISGTGISGGLAADGTLNIYTGQTVRFTAALAPSNPMHMGVTWTTSDENVVSVTNLDSAMTLAVDVRGGGTSGSAQITATSVSNPIMSRTIVVTVLGEAYVTGVEITGPATVAVEETITLTANVQPGFAPERNVNWSVAPCDCVNPECTSGAATITDGETESTQAVLRGDAPGFVVVTATTVGVGSDSLPRSTMQRVEVVGEALAVLFSWARGDDVGTLPITWASNGTTHEINGANWIRHGGNTFSITDEGVVISGNAMLLIGPSATGAPTTATASGTHVPGIFDLSQPATLFIDYTSTREAGNFQVFVNNNTTGMANSVHGGESRLRTGPLPVGSGTLTLPIPAFAQGAEHLPTSFLLLRGADTFGDLTITGIRLVRD